MKPQRLPMSLAATAAAVLSLTLAACGGGNGEPPPQSGGGNTVPAAAPVVTITHNVSAETATGDITFTFSFSRDVGTSFTADSVVVSGGTKGAFTRLSGTSATLVVTPTANATGTVEVSVPAGAVTDAVGTANAAASASKAFNTTAPVIRTTLVSFEESTAPALLGFGGAEDSTVVADPTLGSNKVARVVKGAAAELWAGTTVAICPKDAVARIPFTATLKKMSVRVWSPVAGIPVRLKVENAADATQTAETEATVTTASGWQTLTFDFGNTVAGTPALDPSKTYDKASIFFDFGTPGASVGSRTYFFDDLSFEGSSFTPSCATEPPPPPPPPTGNLTTLTMDEATPPNFESFGGNKDVAVVNDPAGGSNKVARVVKGSDAELWAGTTFHTLPGFAIPRIGFATGKTVITARVWSPVAGVPVRMKVENASNGGQSVETEATVTTASGWQTLSFDFSRQAAGTAALDLAITYNKLSVFFDFGTTGAAVGSDRTYYIDDIAYPTAEVSPPPVATPLVFSTGFSSGNRTVEGGEYGGFSGSNLDGWNCNGDPANCGSGGETAPALPAADSYFFYYYQTNAPAEGLYMGIFVQAPGVVGGFTPSADTGGVQVGAQTQLKFKLGQNPEWFGSSTNNFMIVMDLGKRFTVGADPACRLQLRRVVAPTAQADTDYSIPLNSFSLVQNCGGAASSVADALSKSPVSQISFQGVGGTAALSDGTRTSGANLSVLAGGKYPTTLVLKGGIRIE